jgi:curved DNA-binding protein CbpA
MAAADHSGPGPDHYQLLGVGREASQEQLAQAWRRRARAEHPDSRPADDAAPGRFRALAEAYQVLSDPVRRAAYDRALRHEHQPAVRVPVRWLPGPGATGDPDPQGRPPGPPLRAGPVRVERAHPAPAAGILDERDLRLAVLAEVALHYLVRDRDWPW